MGHTEMPIYAHLYPSMPIYAHPCPSSPITTNNNIFWCIWCIPLYSDVLNCILMNSTIFWLFYRILTLLNKNAVSSCTSSWKTSEYIRIQRNTWEYIKIYWYPSEYIKIHKYLSLSSWMCMKKSHFNSIIAGCA